MDFLGSKQKKQEESQESVEYLLESMMEVIDFTREGDFDKGQGMIYSKLAIINYSIEKPVINIDFNNPLLNGHVNFASNVSLKKEYRISFDNPEEIGLSEKEIEEAKEQGLSKINETYELGKEIIGAIKIFKFPPKNIKYPAMNNAVKILTEKANVLWTTYPNTIYEQLDGLIGVLENFADVGVPIKKDVYNFNDRLSNINKKISQMELYTGKLNQDLVTRVRMNELK